MQKPSRAVELADHTVLPLNNGGNQKKKREFNEAPPVYDITQPTSSFPSVIRRVRPSIQSFDTFAKGRWVGRELLEILSKEFGGHTPEYWLNGILQGHIRINGAKVTPNFVLRNNDRLLHRTHRHEPPVFGEVQLVGETEDYFAVCKPSSMPVHPCGGYRYNSLDLILKYEPFTVDQPPLYLVHRLDKVTSGLVIFAKSPEAANRISQEIRDKTTRKVYLAKVKGRFPQELVKSIKPLIGGIDWSQFGRDDNDNDDDLDAIAADGTTAAKKRPIDDSNPKNAKKAKGPDGSASIPSNKPTPDINIVRQHPNVGFILDEEGYYCVSCPLGVVSKRNGIHANDPETGKASLTRFKALSYDADSDTTVIECQPVTGRTHQIRLHCQLTGHPIANDPCYGGDLFFNQPERAVLAREAQKRLAAEGVVPLTRVLHLPDDEYHNHDNTVSKEKEDEFSSAASTADTKVIEQQEEGESDDDFLTRTCRYCRVSPELRELESLLHCDGIWLHALQYAGKGWSFEAPTPDWANITNDKI